MLRANRWCLFGNLAPRPSSPTSNNQEAKKKEEKSNRKGRSGRRQLGNEAKKHSLLQVQYFNGPPNRISDCMGYIAKVLN